VYADLAAVTKNRTYGKIAGFWVITQKPLIISEILHGVKMISTARSTYSVILK
jgi:DNA-binding transcriptional regulator GbsR (MarR family)